MRLRYREKRATQAAAHLLSLRGGPMSHMKLLKLLYLADREALIRWGRPITFDTYFSLDHGPVLSFTLNKINEDRDPRDPSYWHRHISERGSNEVALVKDAPRDQLSEAEVGLLGEVFEKYGHMSRWEIRDFSHTLPEWRDPEGSSLRIQIRDILEAVGMAPADIEEIEDALAAEESASETLG